MTKHGKKYSQALEKIDKTKVYALGAALELLKVTAYTKFDSTVELAVNLAIDPRKADQSVRGAVTLPHGLGKKVRLVVFAKGQKAIEAKEAGADFVGQEDLAKKIQDGWLDFDKVIATPDMMAVVGRLGKILGPRSLMPNPKLGTVTFDLVNAIKESKQGRSEFKAEKAGIIHTSIGKLSMEAASLEENTKAVMETLLKLKPATSKGNYIKKISLSATMSPGLRVDPTSCR